MSDITTPPDVAAHDADYKPAAWEAYTFAELGQWVHLLATRSLHRSDVVKARKDWQDAQNYLDMLQAKLNVVRDRSRRGV